MLASLQWSPSNFRIANPRCNATRSSSSCCRLLLVAQAQPERARLATQAEADASTQTDPQLQGSPRVLRRQNAMRRRQAQPSPPPFSPAPPQQQPQQQSSQGQLDGTQSQVQQQTGRQRLSERQQRQQQNQKRQAGGGMRNKAVSSKQGLRGSAAAAAQGSPRGREGNRATSEARAEELGAPKGSALATRLSQLLEEEEEEDEENNSGGGDEEVFGEEEVERLVFGGMDFSIAPQPQGQHPQTPTGNNIEACRAALLQPAITPKIPEKDDLGQQEGDPRKNKSLAEKAEEKQKEEFSSLLDEAFLSSPQKTLYKTTTTTTTTTTNNNNNNNNSSAPAPADSATATTTTNSTAAASTHSASATTTINSTAPAPADSATTTTATSSTPTPVESAASRGATQKQQQVSAIPMAVAEMALAAAQGGLVAAVPESLLARTRHLMSVAGGREEKVLQAVQRLREEVGSIGRQTVSEEGAMAALLLVPNIMNLSEQDIRARMTALLNPGLLGKGTTVESLTPLVLSHPELLLAPLNALQSKLTTFRNLMGLTGEAAVAMLNPYMFEGCS